jgi:hypothetical protein
MLINQLITELLTTFIDKNAAYNRNNTDSKLINIASCTACNDVLLVVENLILIWYYEQTATTRASYELIDGRPGWPADIPPNSDELGIYHRTVPGLAVWVCWQPGLPICQQLGSDLETVAKWQSGTVANTTSKLITHLTGLHTLSAFS